MLETPPLELILKNALQWSRQHPGEKVKTIELSRGLKIRARVVEGLKQIVCWWGAGQPSDLDLELELHRVADQAGIEAEGYVIDELDGEKFQIQELEAVILPPVEQTKTQKIGQMLEWAAQRDPFWALPQVAANRKKGLEDLKDLEFDLEWVMAVRQQRLNALERRAA